MAKFPVLAGVALAFVAGSAFAADLPSRKAPPPVYAPPAPVFTWNGLYGGVNIGYGFGANTTETGSFAYPGFPNGGAWNGSLNPNGVLGGGQVGYNYQFSPWLVLGLEADIQASDVHGQSNYVGPGFGLPFNYTAVNSAKNVDWFGTVRGRVGVTLPSMPNLLVYGTGGFAYGQVNQTVSVANAFPGIASIGGRTNYFETATGWTAGGGVEWSPAAFPAWSAKVEYLYTDLGTINQGFSSSYFVVLPTVVPFIGSHTSSTRFHTVRAGLNWHFNPFAVSAPVLAKY
jgi:outer membrane immunogenic protein